MYFDVSHQNKGVKKSNLISEQSDLKEARRSNRCFAVTIIRIVDAPVCKSSITSSLPPPPPSPGRRLPRPGDPSLSGFPRHRFDSTINPLQLAGPCLPEITPTH